MKAAIYYGQKGISVEDREMPAISSKDVLVKNLFGGICGTDINIVRVGAIDRGISAGSEFGHEMVGEVVEVGSNVSVEIKKGMIVGVNPITAKKAGRRESLQCGGFSQYIVVEEAQLNYNLFEMSANVPLEVLALMEPMSVGKHGAFRVNPQKEENIVVLGAGAIGLSAAACLIAEGITNVCVVDIDNMRLEAARKIGANSINTKTVTLREGLIQFFGEVNLYGQSFPNVDVYIDAAGSPGLFADVMNNVKPRTRISIIAVYKNEVPVSLSQVMSKELQIVGASGYTDEDIRKVVAYINESKTNIGIIVSKVYKLTDISEAFETAIAGSGVIKVLVDLW